MRYRTDKDASEKQYSMHIRWCKPDAQKFIAKCMNQCVHMKSLGPDTSAVKKDDINYKELVGKNVRKLRLQSELSQEALAERCGIFRTYLSRVESGSANPSIVVLVALAHSLGVPPHLLFMQQ